jgi:hypothetical protein
LILFLGQRVKVMLCGDKSAFKASEMLRSYKSDLIYETAEVKEAIKSWVAV